jgi:hypothetical protein
MKRIILIATILTIALLVAPSTNLDAQIFKKRTKRVENQQQSESEDKNSIAGDISWKCLGPAGMPNSLCSSKTYGVGQMHRIEFDPMYDGDQNQTVYACSSFGGLWRSENDGDNWEVVNTDNLPSTSVADVCINPFNRNEIFICSGYADGSLYTPFGPNWTHVIPIYTTGIHRSKDYGKTWEDISSGFISEFRDGGFCRKMAINPFNPDQIFIATNQGLYTSSNATSNNVKWKNVSIRNKKDENDFRGLAFKPDDSNTIYASSKNIFRSQNGGSNWTSITGSEFNLDLTNLPDSFSIKRINIAVSPAAPERLYAYISGTRQVNGKFKDGAHIAVFEDEKWRIIETRYTSGLAYFDESWIALAVSPVDPDFVVYANTRVFGSEDIENKSFGLRSSYCGDGFHADVHDLEFQPNVENPKLFCGNHGGMSVKTLPDASTKGWEYKNEGIATATLWSFDDSEVNEGIAIIATQDNGTMAYIDTLGFKWHFLKGGDGYSARIDDVKPDQAYLSGGDRSLAFFDFKTLKITDQTGKLPKDPRNETDVIITTKTFPMVNHPETGALLFGFTEVFQKNIVAPAVTTRLEDIWELKSDITRLEIEAWKRQITEIAICENNPDYVYLITGGQQNPPDSEWHLRSRLYKSTKGFKTNDRNNYFEGNAYPGENFDNDTLAILSSVAVDPDNPDLVYLGYAGLPGQFRVWYSDNGGKDWHNADPNRIFNKNPVNAIAIDKDANNRLYAGTDFGLYTKDEGEDWEKVEEFPSVRITELKINKRFNKIRIATFGRGLWEGPLEASNTHKPGDFRFPD